LANLIETDICIIGAGSAGLSIAAGASQMGADTVLIESGKMGGDCLNYGCVPSKALLAAGKAAKLGSRAAPFGVLYQDPTVDFQAVHDHVKSVIEAIAPNDSVERFEGMGVRVIQALGRFVAPDEVDAGGQRVKARRFVVATGSRPFVPPIPGLDQVPHLTNETIFDLTQLPRHLIVIGGGPIGCELGQAFRHLGAEVSLAEMFDIMPRDDPELVDILRGRFRADGIALYEQSKVVRVERRGDDVAVTIERAGAVEKIIGSHLLVAAGRKANVEDLGLENAGIAYDRQGITVDRRLRSSNKKIFAAGDVSGGYQFTHMAGYHAGIVIRNALFRLPAKVNDQAVPWVTFTAPELAHAGLGEAEAKERYGEIRVLRWPFAENDRAQTERETDGLIKVITTKRGKILGAAILGPHAGELIHAWVVALSKGMNVGAMAGYIAPYPTLGEVGKRAAGSFYSERLFGAGIKRIVRFLARFG
jgi:pyruvate/2-oxoglutarate dehydrogenase complex dihydrolipoamide dehydrogenase (E3) component